MRLSLFTVTAILILSSCGGAADSVRFTQSAPQVLEPPPEPPTSSCADPVIMSFEPIRVIQRSARGLTQGLLFESGALLESTGLIAGHGASVINRIDPETGSITRLTSTPDGDFGEGLVRHRDSLFQLTYKDGKIHEYESDGSASGTRHLKAHASPLSQGWGLTTDGTDLLATDGSATMYRLDPETLKIRARTKVKNSQGDEIDGLNELEFVQGQVWANLFPTSKMIRFDAVTGCQTAEVDLSALRLAFQCPNAALECTSPAVANGIAYDPVSDLYWLTGKSWPVIYQGRFKVKGL